MPVITINCPKVTKEQKARLVKELVTSASEILNIPKEGFITYVKENDLDNIGVGTELLSDKRK
jgi:4-oxalocrotonate tautomerase